MKNIHGRNPQIAPEKSKSSRIKAIRVTICRDARSCVRCIKCYSVGLLSVSVGSTTDAQTVRPYKSLHVELLHVGLLLYHGFNGDGRTTVRPYKLLHVRSLHVNCYCVVVLTGTDARPCVPTNRYSSSAFVQIVIRLAVLQRTHDRASLQIVTRQVHPYKPLFVSLYYDGRCNLEARQYLKQDTIKE